MPSASTNSPLRLGRFAATLSAFRASQLHRNAIAGSGQVIVTAAIACISYPVYLRFLGYELYGLWLTLGVVLTFAQFGKVGLVPAMTKHVAEEYGRGDMVAVRSYVTTGLTVLGVMGCAMLGLVLALRSQFVTALRLDTANSLLALRLTPWIAVLSIYVLQIEALNAVLAGLGRMDVASVLQVVARLISLSVATFLLANGVGIASLLWSNAVAYVFVHAATLIAVHRITGAGCLSTSGFDLRRLRALAGFGSGVFGASLINMLIAPFNKIMLARYAGVGLVPVFDLSWSLSMQLRSIVDSGVSAIMPEISRLLACQEPRARARIQQVRDRAKRLAFVLGLVICGSAAVFAGPVLRVWLGPRFHVLLPDTLRIILIGVFIEVSSIPTYYTLLALGQVSKVFLSNAIAACANVLCVIGVVLLAPEFSVGLLALCVTVSLTASAVYLLAFAKPYISGSTPVIDMRQMRTSSDLVG